MSSSAIVAQGGPAPALVVEQNELVIRTVAEQGPAGSSVSYRGTRYDQLSAQSTWVVAHNLGLRPAVQTFSVGGVQIEGSVTHLSDNVVQVDFNVPVAGYARLI